MLSAVAVTIDSIMKPVFGTPTGTGVGADRRDRDADADRRRRSGKSGLRWCLSTRMKPRGLVSPSMPAHGGDAAEGRQHHRVGEGQFVRLADRAVLADLLDRHLAGFDRLHAGVGDPLDVAVAHLAFEQALGVADAVEAEMADIGLGGDEGHRHAVAELAALAQLGVEDERRTRRPGRSRMRPAPRRPRSAPATATKRSKASLAFDGVIDMADRLGVAARARGPGSRRRRGPDRWR